MVSLSAWPEFRYFTGRWYALASAKEASFRRSVTSATWSPKSLSKIWLNQRYVIIPRGWPMERRCPRNTKRSNPARVPAILSWCLAINSCMGVLLRIVIGFWNEPAMIRRWGAPRSLDSTVPEDEYAFRMRERWGFAKADCQRLIAESLPKCFGCGYAALCRVRVWLTSVLLDRRPSLLTLRQRSSVFVRMIHRYYSVV